MSENRRRELREDIEYIERATVDLRPQLDSSDQRVLDDLVLQLKLRPEEMARYVDAILALSAKTTRVSETIPARADDEPSEGHEPNG